MAIDVKKIIFVYIPGDELFKLCSDLNTCDYWAEYADINVCKDLRDLLTLEQMQALAAGTIDYIIFREE